MLPLCFSININEIIHDVYTLYVYTTAGVQYLNFYHKFIGVRAEIANGAFTEPDNIF